MRFVKLKSKLLKSFRENHQQKEKIHLLTVNLEIAIMYLTNIMATTERLDPKKAVVQCKLWAEAGLDLLTDRLEGDICFGSCLEQCSSNST